MKKKTRSKTSRQRPEAETAARVVEITVQQAQAGERVDRLVSAAIEGLSRSAAQQLIRQGQITVNAAPVKASHRPQAGERVIVRLPPPQNIEIRPEPIPLTILYQDDSLIVVDKPAGMVTHPAHGHFSGTLVNALLAHYPPLAQTDAPERAGIVHRLDKDTSGLIVVAKTPAVRQALQAQFKARQVHKTYLALVEGRLTPSLGIVEAPIGRDPNHRQRMAVLHDGRRAVTRYRVQEFFERHSLAQIEPETGRTHQIRVHMAFLRHPVVGDRVYGYRKQRLPLKRLFLHAQRLRFQHPQTGQSVEFEAELPSELAALLERLKFTR